MASGRSGLLATLAFGLGFLGTARDACGEADPRMLKVFLADFDDVPRPETYTRECFVDLFFGRGSPRSTPEGRPIAGSVREYFLDLSDGRIDIAGEVADWVRIPRRISEIPHWKRGMPPFTALAATTRPWSRNALGELWWEFRNMTPRPDRSILFDAHFRAVDLVSEYHTAEWRDQDGNAVSPGTYGSAGGHVTIRHTDSPDAPGSGAVLHCRPAPGGSMTGRYTLTGRKPSRVYLVVSRPSPDSPPATLSVTAGKRKVLEASPVGPAAPSGVVLDVPAGHHDVRIEVRSPADAESSDGVYVRQGWMVEMPSTVVDLTAGQPASDTGPVAAEHPAFPLFDGFCYGPGCVAVGTDGDEGDRASREFDLPLLPPGADLRALVGLSAETPEGAKARISFEFLSGQDVTPAVTGIELRMDGMDRGEWPGRLPNATAIVEAGGPAPVRESGDARLRVTVERVGDTPATVVLPCLRVTGD